MDATQFDRMTRTLARRADRRQVLAGAVAAAAAAVIGRGGAGAQWVSPPAVFVCGGYADTPCPTGRQCVYPADACDDPSLGCTGMCVAIPDGGGEACGSAICGNGEYCCNASCSRCVPNGKGCTREFCPNQPVGVVCDQNVCQPGEVCCPGGCGICTTPGGVCPAIACLPGA